ncbi:hypothetical protein HPB49_018386 [Dermacentor silvarum]|uniref:Uncharacterized protein n=1 Tax=Dermacentor silvarum TaxID=543639 RepID=A0ACB8E1M2_DERSI|nr:hypothetical protein HPB49_018386 [Dermacentor silvarum]
MKKRLPSVCCWWRAPHEQEVGRDVTLMDLVNEFAVLLPVPHQDADCTEEYASAARQQLLRETDLEAGGVAQLQE